MNITEPIPALYSHGGKITRHRGWGTREEGKLVSPYPASISIVNYCFMSISLSSSCILLGPLENEERKDLASTIARRTHTEAPTFGQSERL